MMVRSQLRAPAVLPRRKTYHWMGDWVDLEPVWMSGAEQKRSLRRESNSDCRVVHPMA